MSHEQPRPATASPADLAQEEVRIKEAYRRRPSDDPRYSWFSPGHVVMEQSYERAFLAMLRQRAALHSLGEQRILEIGCGPGHRLRQLVKWGADPRKVAGIDLRPDSIAEARSVLPAALDLRCGSATEVGFADASFDIILLITVFSSVLDAEMKRRLAREALRVLRADGVLVWYDFFVNNPANPDVRGVRKKELRQLFPGCRLELRRITLAPPLSRTLARWSYLLCYLLEKIPFLRTHYFGLIRKG